MQDKSSHTNLVIYSVNNDGERPGLPKADDHDFHQSGDLKMYNISFKALLA